MEGWSQGWCLTESDPGVFTEIAACIGAECVQVEEILGLDADSFALPLERFENVYGFIFLFKWGGAAAGGPGGAGRASPAAAPPPSLFFARQEVENACGTQALLHIIFNAPGLPLGAELRALRDFAADLDPSSRGLAIGSSDLLRNAHNAFKQQTAFDVEAAEGDAAAKDAFHFVAYVPAAGSVWELDGLAHGPLRRGDCGGGGRAWCDVARSCIAQRIAAFMAASGDSSEIRFNVMAVCENLLARLDREMADLKDDDARLALLQAMRAEEAERRAAWTEENVRRQHNFTPLILCALRLMAERDLDRRYADLMAAAAAKGDGGETGAAPALAGPPAAPAAASH